MTLAALQCTHIAAVEVQYVKEGTQREAETFAFVGHALWLRVVAHFASAERGAARCVEKGGHQEHSGDEDKRLEELLLIVVGIDAQLGAERFGEERYVVVQRE